jgi:proline iminopeptidase
MRFVAAALDIRPSWPLEQLAALAPHGEFTRVPDVPHDFWATHPDVWVRVVTDACNALSRLP